MTPPVLADPSIAIAATRAGGIGVLDLQYCTDTQAALAAVGDLANYSKSNYGIKLGGSDCELITRLKPLLTEQLSLVILSLEDSLEEQISLLKDGYRSLLLETTSIEEAKLGEALGFNGLIAKGNESGGRVGEENTFILLQALLNRSQLPIWGQGGIGLHNAAACLAAGAAGIVLDAQLWLLNESALPELAKSSIAHMDGS